MARRGTAGVRPILSAAADATLLAGADTPLAEGILPAEGIRLEAGIPAAEGTRLAAGTAAEDIPVAAGITAEVS